MGLLQSAIETYDRMEAEYAGIEYEGKETLAPIAHIIAKPKIEITIDEQGNFSSARKCDAEKKIAIPVTEESAVRTSGARAHALCDQIQYVADIIKEKHELYVKQLEDWYNSFYSHPKVKAVFLYVSKNVVLEDLMQAGLLELDKNEKIKNEKDLICWNVVGLGEKSGPVWCDLELMKQYIRYYYASINESNSEELCFLSGKKQKKAKFHIKGVVANSGNAKIISVNDTKNFTYRGRFKTAEEALTISYISSQKAHNALKWIVANNGVSVGSRTFICWNPKGYSVPHIINPLLVNDSAKSKPTEYREKLRRAIAGDAGKLPQNESVIIAGFDVATTGRLPTTGRLSITYYNELSGSDFLERLLEWDASCCWYDSFWGASSPTLKSIVTMTYGVQRHSGEKSTVELDTRIAGQQMQRLLHCRIDKALLSTDLMMRIVQNASNMQTYTTENRRKLLFTACAVVKKYRYDHLKEEWNMALEEYRKDRSYQFGRLLAIMEKIEKDTYESDEEREANAIRMQTVFVQKPGYATKIILGQLKNAYYPRLKPGLRGYYDKMIGQIMEIISAFDEEYNKSLSETYLLGYYLQKNALYTKKEKDNNSEVEK